jgi:hypothetical protein
MILYCESFRYSGKVALNAVINDLTKVSGPEEDHSSHQPSHMALRDQHFHAHSGPALLCPLQVQKATHK